MPPFFRSLLSFRGPGRMPDGVRCYSPAGELLGKIHVPEQCANLVCGGPLHNRLYMCASTSVCACYVDTQGGAATS
jgi:sugar lactone lactonase YvrE